VRENLIYKEITLKPLFLSIEEENDKKQEYEKIISKMFPSLVDITQAEFKLLKSKVSDEQNYEKLKQVALKSMCDQVEYIYLHYCVNGYDFEDMLLDVYMVVQEKFYQYLNAEFVSEFKFFFDRLSFREVMAKLNRNAKNNIDLHRADRKLLKTDLNIDKVIVDERNINEYNLIYKDFVNDIKKYLNQLSPRYQKLLTMYYGLNNRPALKMNEIAEVYGVTRSLVQKHISTALIELEKMKDKEYIKDYKDGFEF